VRAGYLGERIELLYVHCTAAPPAVYLRNAADLDLGSAVGHGFVLDRTSQKRIITVVDPASKHGTKPARRSASRQGSSPDARYEIRDASKESHMSPSAPSRILYLASRSGLTHPGVVSAVNAEATHDFEE
jgi:hypothetical protein